MKNRKLLTLTALAGITVGGLSIGSASAQGYGGQQEAPAAQTSAQVDTATNLQVQDTGTDGTVEQDGESRRGRHGGGCSLDAAAEAIGIDKADLKEALESGESVADVAAANGVDIDSVIDAMVAEKAERLADKVESGRITQAEADQKLEGTEAKITDRVNESADSSEDLS